MNTVTVWQVLPYLVRSNTEPNNGRSKATHNLTTTVSDNDNTLDAQLLTASIFLTIGRVEYMIRCPGR